MPPPTAAYRGLDEDFFQALRHCRRIRPRARCGAPGRVRAAQLPQAAPARPGGRRRSARSQADAGAAASRRSPAPRGEAPTTRVRRPATATRRCPRDGIGQPERRTIGFQDQVTPIGEEAAWFHDIILMPVITVITLFVLAAAAWVIVPLPPRRQSGAVADHPQHPARGGLDAGAGADPGGDRGAVDPAARAPIFAAAGRPHRQGDRQPMVLGL